MKNTEFYVVTEENSYKFPSYKQAKKVFETLFIKKGLYKVTHDDVKYWQFYSDCFDCVLLEGYDILSEIEE